MCGSCSKYLQKTLQAGHRVTVLQMSSCHYTAGHSAKSFPGKLVVTKLLKEILRVPHSHHSTQYWSSARWVNFKPPQIMFFLRIRKDGARPTFFLIFVLFYVLFVLFYVRVFLCCSMYCLFCVFLCIVCVYMCTVLLPPGGYPIAVKFIISYQLFFFLFFDSTWK
jgi:hypothetical protein